MRRATAAIFTMITLAATAAACSSSPSVPTGTVSGMLIRVGGPAPGAPVPLPGQVTATPVASGSAHTSKVGADGQFEITLAPGAYRFTGHSPMIQGGKLTCIAVHVVHVSSGNATVGVNVICPIR
jgi:hypothetical protein